MESIVISCDQWTDAVLQWGKCGNIWDWKLSEMKRQDKGEKWG